MTEHPSAPPHASCERLECETSGRWWGKEDRKRGQGKKIGCKDPGQQWKKGLGWRWGGRAGMHRQLPPCCWT